MDCGASFARSSFLSSLRLNSDSDTETARERGKLDQQPPTDQDCICTTHPINPHEHYHEYLFQRARGPLRHQKQPLRSATSLLDYFPSNNEVLQMVFA
jgi:hypothetical protein